MHKLSLLSESLGYINLIGRWGGSTNAKVKGITGDVLLSSSSTGNTSLVDGRVWRSFPGLHGEKCFSQPGSMTRVDLKKHLPPGNPSSPTWYSALFDSPGYDPSRQALFLKLTKGRGMYDVILFDEVGIIHPSLFPLLTCCFVNVFYRSLVLEWKVRIVEAGCSVYPTQENLTIINIIVSTSLNQRFGSFLEYNKNWYI